MFGLAFGGMLNVPHSHNGGTSVSSLQKTMRSFIVLGVDWFTQSNEQFYSSLRYWFTQIMSGFTVLDVTGLHKAMSTFTVLGMDRFYHQ